MSSPPPPPNSSASNSNPPVPLNLRAARRPSQSKPTRLPPATPNAPGTSPLPSPKLPKQPSPASPPSLPSSSSVGGGGGGGGASMSNPSLRQQRPRHSPAKDGGGGGPPAASSAAYAANSRSGARGGGGGGGQIPAGGIPGGRNVDGGGGGSRGSGGSGGGNEKDRKSKVGTILFKKRQSIAFTGGKGGMFGGAGGGGGGGEDFLGGFGSGGPMGIPGLPSGPGVDGRRGGGGPYPPMPPIPGSAGGGSGRPSAGGIPPVPSLPNQTMKGQQDYSSSSGRPSSRGENREKDRRGDGKERGGGLPSSLVPGGLRGDGRERERGMGMGGLDIDSLQAEGAFNADEFLKRNLPGWDRNGANVSSEAQAKNLRDFKGMLKHAADETSKDLQKNVFKNYSEFVTISKEISTLENEMLEMKSVLEEWRKIPETLDMGGGIGSGIDFDLSGSDSLGDAPPTFRRSMSQNRNSIADLATLYRAQLEALWENVEGSQRFLPPLPNRHLIAESPSFIELNAATYRPKQAVHLFLLNDALLVAVKKRTGAGTAAGDGMGSLKRGQGGSLRGDKGRLVAERCFNLSEIAVVDMKDGGDLTNAIKVRRGRETSIYRTEKAPEKKALLVAFKKVAEELINKKRKETAAAAAAAVSSPSAAARNDLRGRGFGGWGIAMGKLEGEHAEQVREIGRRLGFDDAGGEGWIGDFESDLEVKIKLGMWEEAVELIEKGKSTLPQLGSISTPLASHLRALLSQSQPTLISALLNALSQPYVHKPEIVRLVSLCLRLGEAEQARETFLKMRADGVRKRVRAVKWRGGGFGSTSGSGEEKKTVKLSGGGLRGYVAELAMVWMGMVKNTGEWYLAAFKDQRMASGFVKWAAQQMELFAEMFRRQVSFGIGTGVTVPRPGEGDEKIDYEREEIQRLVKECVEITMSYASQLRDVGLDFTYLLSSLLDIPSITNPQPVGRRHSLSSIGGTRVNPVHSMLLSPNTVSAMGLEVRGTKDEAGSLSSPSGGSDTLGVGALDARSKRVSAIDLKRELEMEKRKKVGGPVRNGTG